VVIYILEEKIMMTTKTKNEIPVSRVGTIQQIDTLIRAAKKLRREVLSADTTTFVWMQSELNAEIENITADIVVGWIDTFKGENE
jgi:hypothetical protein